MGGGELTLGIAILPKFGGPAASKDAGTAAIIAQTQHNPIRTPDTLPP